MKGKTTKSTLKEGASLIEVKCAHGKLKVQSFRITTKLTVDIID